MSLPLLGVEAFVLLIMFIMPCWGRGVSGSIFMCVVSEGVSKSSSTAPGRGAARFAKAASCGVADGDMVLARLLPEFGGAMRRRC